MNKIKYLVLLVLITGLLSWGLSKAQTNAWLKTQRGESTLNLSGVWDTGGVVTGGWGEARIVHINKEITGTMGMYNINGNVNGNNVYLVICSGSKVYYTAHLTASSPDKLMGKAVYKAIIGRKGSENAAVYPMIFKKIGDE